MNTYDIGDQVEVYAAFTTRKLTAAEVKAFQETLTLPAGTGAEPGVVKCTVLSPGGSVSEAVTEKKATGVFKATIGPDKHGTWYAAFDATGGFKAAGEHTFKVREQRVAR